MPLTRALILLALFGASHSASADDFLLLLEARSCPNCELADTDLVHADLRNADLKAADLQRANLGRARLDGADLRGADLRWASLRGASLRGVDLRKSNLYGTDLRQADLTGAHLTIASLEQAHWAGARGISSDILSHASLHNAGVNAAHQNNWNLGQRLFSSAIAADPSIPISWIGRGICLGELGLTAKSSADFAHAGELFHQKGDIEKSGQLFKASREALIEHGRSKGKENEMGGSLLNGAHSLVHLLTQLALRAYH